MLLLAGHLAVRGHLAGAALGGGAGGRRQILGTLLLLRLVPLIPLMWVQRWPCFRRMMSVMIVVTIDVSNIVIPVVLSRVTPLMQVSLATSRVMAKLTFVSRLTVMMLG